MGPLAKRNPLAQLIAEGADDEDGDELNFHPHEVSEMRDPDVQLEKKRQAVGNRFQAAMSGIFDKYSRDFEDVGDEIDFETGEIVVDNGHLANMRYDGDIGSPDGLDGAQSDGEEDEGILLEHWESDSHSSAVGSGGDDEGPDLPSTSQASKNTPSAPADQQNWEVIGGYPWNFGPPSSFSGPGSNTVPFWPFPHGQQLPHFAGQPGVAFPSLDQHPALLPWANFHPPFMSGQMGPLPTFNSRLGAESLSQAQPKKRIQRSLFTSRFSQKGKKKDSDENDLEKDETANSDSQSGQVAHGSRYLTDDEDELLSEQHTITPQNPEKTDSPLAEGLESSTTIPPSDLNPIQDEPEDKQDKVPIDPSDVPKHWPKQCKHISIAERNGVLPTPPTSVADVSDSDGDRGINKRIAESLRQDSTGPIESANEKGSGNEHLSPDDSTAQAEKSDHLNDTSIKSEENEAGLSFSQATAHLDICLGLPSPLEPASDPPAIDEANFSRVSETSFLPKQPTVSRSDKLSDDPETMYISPTKPRKGTHTKPSPVRIPSEPGSVTSQKVSRMPLTPRHARTTTMRTPSTRRSILSLLSDEEEDEALFSEKHTVSIPNLFSSSRRKRGRSSGHHHRSKIYETPTKKRPRKEAPSSATKSAQVVCGVDNYQCGRDFCFNCLPD